LRKMNKDDIKQIILEEIEAAINEMATPEKLAAQSFIDDEENDDRIAQAMETGDEDELEDLAAGELDRAEIERDWRDEQDAIFGKPNFVEEEGLEENEYATKDIENAIEKGKIDPEKVKAAAEKALKGDSKDLALLMALPPLKEMARTSNIFKLSQEASVKDVLQFMQRVNDVLKTYKSPGQKRPKKRFTPEEMKTLATAMVNPEGFTSKDVIAATSYSSPAQANKFLKALEMKGLITLTSQLKKSMTPKRDPNAPETRGRKRRDAEFDMSDDPMADLDALGLGGSIDLSDPLAENNNTMSELEKYIKKVIKEAKNPLAKRMKEIENQGRIAALETKLAAIAEMIEETEGRLTRIDEDNEFKEMMDRNAVRDVRKQLKELERAQAKLQKEYDKAAGGRKQEKVVDEVDADKLRDLADQQDALDQKVDDSVEEVSFELNESTLRFQKLAGLITESDIKKKLSLNENETLDPLVTSDKVNPDEEIGQVLSTRDSIDLDKISGDYLAKKYKHTPFKTLNITPEKVKNALSQLKKVKVTDGEKLVSDFNLGDFGEYALIIFNNKKYLSSDGGRYITAIVDTPEDTESSGK
jgi:CBS domain-containing protein